MRRIFVFLFLCSLSWAQTASITGKVVDPGNGNQSVNTKVQMELIGCAGNQPRYNGTALLWPVIKKYDTDSSGNISGTIYRSDSITCGTSTASNKWRMTVIQNGQAGPPCDVRITSASFDATQPNCLNAQPTIPAPTDTATWARVDATNLPFTGNVTAKSIENAVYLDYYATCDGTTDDSTAIQTAITAAANKTLVLPAGKTCGVGLQLTIANPMNFLMYGTLKALTTGTATPLVISTSSNVNIDCGNVGGINGNSKAWGGIRFRNAGTFLSDGSVTNCSFASVAKGATDVEVLGSYSGKNTIFSGNHISSSGVTTATTGGNFGIYFEYCQGCTATKNYLDTVGSTGINVSGGVGNKVLDNHLTNITLYAVKGGYGLPGTVSADVAASTTAFTVTKNTTTSGAYAPGQYVTIVHSATTTCDGYVKSVTDHTTYLTIATSTLTCTPSSGDTIETPDTGTLIDGNDILYTGADAMDFNITKDITFINNRFKFAGLYTTPGTINAVNSCIWVGADPQTISPYGLINPFKSDNVSIKNNVCVHAGGSGIGVYTSNNVNISGNIVQFIDEGGFDATTATDPAYGCIEVGRLGAIRSNQISVVGNTCDTSIGYGTLINFARNAVMSHNVIKAPFGMKGDALIAGEISNNMVEATAANCYGLRLGDPSGANASSGISLSGNQVRGDVASCNALKQTDAGATLINEVGQNFWQVPGGTAIVTAVTIGSGTPNDFALKTGILSGSTSGTTTLKATAVAGTTVQTLQAVTGTIANITGSAVLNAFCSGVATSSVTVVLFNAGASTIPCTDTTSNLLYPLPSAGTLRNLSCKSSAAGSTAGSGLVTVFKNGVATALTCTVGTGTTCTDTTHTVSFAAADTFGINAVTGAVETLANLRCSVEKF